MRTGRAPTCAAGKRGCSRRWRCSRAAGTTADWSGERAAPVPLARGFPPIAGDSRDTHSRKLTRTKIAGNEAILCPAAERVLADHGRVVRRRAGAAIRGSNRAADRRGLAVWDVLAAGERTAASIRRSSQRASWSTIPAVSSNAIRRLGLICFNGAKAAELYRPTVLPTFRRAVAAIESACCRPRVRRTLRRASREARATGRPRSGRADTRRRWPRVRSVAS